ncbi:MAG: substrate-binding domain-containing protein [Akkermansiaceae bacterium]
MDSFRIFSHAEQTAQYLAHELLNRRWSGTMPGAPTLAAELEINHKTIEAALLLMEAEGTLVSQGSGRARRIAPLSVRKNKKSLRIGVLLHEDNDRQAPYILQIIQHLKEAGHVIYFTPKSMIELGMEIKRITPMVKKIEADAWIVLAGSSEVLEWFATQNKPTFSIFGRPDGLAIPYIAPDTTSTCLSTIRHLIQIGHRRIVSMDRSRRSFPDLGKNERAILAELSAHDIPSGEYNIPMWENSIEGFHEILDSLFSMTPPTALILYETPLFIAAQQFLSRRGLQVPDDVSMICASNEVLPLAWCQPKISHFSWDRKLLVKRVDRWAGRVSKGQKDVRQSFIPAELILGGTIGPAKR